MGLTASGQASVRIRALFRDFLEAGEAGEADGGWWVVSRGVSYSTRCEGYQPERCRTTVQTLCVVHLWCSDDGIWHMVYGVWHTYSVWHVAYSIDIPFRRT